MSNWLFVVCMVLVGAVLWQQHHVGALREDLARRDAIIDGWKEQAEINQRHDGIDKDLQDGGEDSLSDYLRGAAGKLWP